MKQLLVLGSLFLSGCIPKLFHHHGALQGLYCDDMRIFTTDDTGNKFKVKVHDWVGNFVREFEINEESHGDDLSYIFELDLFFTSAPKPGPLHHGNGILAFNDKGYHDIWGPNIFTSGVTSVDSKYVILSGYTSAKVYSFLDSELVYDITYPHINTWTQGVTRVGDTLYILQGGLHTAHLISIDMESNDVSITPLVVPNLSKHRNEAEGLSYCKGNLYTTVSYGKRKSVTQIVYKIVGSGLVEPIKLEAAPF